MPKFIVLEQRFDTPEDCAGDYYLNIAVNDVFANADQAALALRLEQQEELKELNENDGNPDSPNWDGIPTYQCCDNTIIDRHGNTIVAYYIVPVELKE